MERGNALGDHSGSMEVHAHSARVSCLIIANLMSRRRCQDPLKAMVFTIPYLCTAYVL